MTEMTPDEVSLADTLRHIADDHPCCRGSLLAAAARIEALERLKTEVRACGVASDVRGLDYVEVQIPRRLWDAFAAEEKKP